MVNKHRRRGETTAEWTVERRVRRQLAKVGLKLERDRSRTNRTPARRGGYRISDADGKFVLGRYRAEMYADNFANHRNLPEAALIELFERQERNVFVGELRQSIATAYAAADPRRQDQRR